MTTVKPNNRNQALNHSQAIKLIIQHAEKLTSTHETIALADAFGRTTATAITAPINVPSAACSSMDGYAINLSEIQANQTDTANTSRPTEYVLKIGQPIHAAKQSRQLSCDEMALPIMTGGLLPVDADGIVLKEHGQVKEGSLYFDKLPKKGEYIRTSGSDLQLGQTVVKANQDLCVASLGLLSSLGIAEVQVLSKPRVALMMTGDELVQPGNPCAAGQIYDSNSVMLSHLLQEMGCQVTLFQTLEDSEKAVNRRLEDLAKEAFHFIITVGGVSMGEKDWIPKALSQQGTVVFHKLRIKPGFPLLFGELGQSLFYGLPGNPVSSYTTLCQYVFPAIQSMTQQAPHLTSWRAMLAHDIKKSHLRREYMRGMFEVDHQGSLQVSVCGGQQSSRIESLSQANCFIVLNESQQDLFAGDTVVIQPFTDFRKCQ